MGPLSQFEGENDLGSGGGELDDETLGESWQAADERRNTANLEDEEGGLGDLGVGVTEEDAALERMMDDEDAGMGGGETA